MDMSIGKELETGPGARIFSSSKCSLRMQSRAANWWMTTRSVVIISSSTISGSSQNVFKNEIHFCLFKKKINVIFIYSIFLLLYLFFFVFFYYLVLYLTLAPIRGSSSIKPLMNGTVSGVAPKTRSTKELKAKSCKRGMIFGLSAVSILA